MTRDRRLLAAGLYALLLCHQGRNPYDKLGHFAQGLVPALLAREIVLRTGAVSGKRMAGFVGICVAMTVSACYELVEWGAVISMLALAQLHDRAMARLEKENAAP